jgi:hypothetical protein
VVTKCRGHLGSCASGTDRPRREMVSWEKMSLWRKGVIAGVRNGGSRIGVPSVA